MVPTHTIKLLQLSWEFGSFTFRLYGADEHFISFHLVTYPIIETQRMVSAVVVVRLGSPCHEEQPRY